MPRRSTAIAVAIGALAIGLGGGVPAAGAATLKAHGSIKQAYVLGAKKSQRLVLRDASGRTVASGRADRFGSKIFRDVRPGRGYSVLAGKRKTRRVQGPASRPESEALVLQAPDAQAGPQLREDARRGGARHDGAASRRQEAQRRPVPDLRRVLRLPGRGSERPLRLGGQAGHHGRAGRPARARVLDRRGLAGRTAPRVRGRERADARLRLLRRRIRPVRPADHLRRLRRGGGRGGAEVGEGREGRHGRHLLLGHHPAVRGRHQAAAPRRDRADVGERRSLHGHGLPGRHLQLGLREDLGAGAHG